MDANGTRFQLLLGYDDWGACSDALTPPGAVPRPLRQVWEASPAGSASSDLAWGVDRSELTLRGLLLRLTPSRGYVAPTLDDRRGAGRDRYGNWYWIAPSGTELLVNSAGTANTSHFWSPGDGLACTTPDPSPGGFQAQNAPPPPAALALAGLAVTEEHYLVVGVLEPAGLLIFDLHAGGPPRQVLWPAGVPFVPFDMAAAPGGGVWILDRLNARYWALDRQFRVIARDQAAGAAPARDDFRPLAGGAVSRTPAPGFPEGILLDAASPLAAGDPIAVEALPDGTVLILDRNPGGPYSLAARYSFGQQLGQPVPTFVPPDLVEDGTTAGLAIVAHDFAFLPEHLAADGTTVLDRLYIVGADGGQGFAFLLSQQGGQLVMQALTDDLPLRLFGGKGLAAAGGQVYYDFADRWIPLAAQRRPRYAATADLYTPANVPTADGTLPPQGGRPPFDGRVPDCVWHRLMLDASIPPQTQVVVWSRAANSPADLTRAEWQQEPPLYLRGDGSEQPFVPPRTAPGDGTWELLFQRARGRYLQLRLNVSGNQRATPRLRALRAYYPRFSYLQRYLPAVYRQDSASASFLDRFLANSEGFFTALEDKIAAVQMLFDPASAPTADLAWLAGWFGVILDPTWDERKQRLFLKNAMLFFQYRGTVRGLEMALRLANDPCAEQDVFDDPALATAPRSFRIVERWQARTTPGLLPGNATSAPLPGQGSAPTGWTPAQGGAALNRLYTQALAAAGAPPGPVMAFPLAAPTDQTAAVWAQFARATLGFVPSTSAADAGRWQDFLGRRYRRVGALNQAYGTSYTTFANAPLPQSLPADGQPLADWYQFQAIVLTAYQSAHRFTVLLPAPPTNTNGAAQQARLDLTRRVIDLEKPAHTIYDIQFYWAYFRVGTVRLGDDSIIDRGSRAPQLLPPLVLGQGCLAGSYLAPGYPQNVCERPVVGRGRLGR